MCGSEINQNEKYNGILTIFSTTIDKILCFMGPHKMKTSHYFQSCIPSATWDYFDF